SEKHPHWRGVFRKTPDKAEPLSVDLGVWAVLGHPDKPKVQKQLKETICRSLRMPSCSWSDDEYLEKSIGMFKTPTLRSLGQSKPYFHNGQAETLLDVLAVYLATSRLIDRGQLRNPDPMLKAMDLKPGDFPALKAFMEALDEDYE
ncbi:MAG: hypothetical protein AAF203_05905, partial [Pseudomonadota bacterium]